MFIAQISQGVFRGLMNFLNFFNRILACSYLALFAWGTSKQGTVNFHSKIDLVLRVPYKNKSYFIQFTPMIYRNELRMLSRFNLLLINKEGVETQ